MTTDGFAQLAYDNYVKDDKTATLKSQGGNYGGGSETLIIDYQKRIGALCARDHKGVGSQYVSEGKLVIEGMDGYNATLTGDKSATLGVNCGMSTGRNGICAFHGQSSHAAGVSISEEVSPTLMNAKQVDVLSDALVRRLTPLECERLQGFPDLWTDIGDYTDTKGKQRKLADSARYKALGNSIAIPPWFYVLQKLNLCCGADHTMASLFDGIGGFPLIWEMLNGEGSCIWASEIEDFPIAVTKVRFPEE